MSTLRSFIAEARRSLDETETSEPSELGKLVEQSRELLERGFRVGTVRKWNGAEFQKQSDSSWSKVPTRGRRAAAPIPTKPGVKKKATASAAAPSTPAAPAPVAKAPAKGPEKTGTERATPDSLPDDPFKYFKKTADAQLIPVSALKTIRARPEGIRNAATHMANAFNGDGEKRKPISLKDNGDGTYTVTDGNSTTAMARDAKWKNIVAVVEPADKPGDDNKHHASHTPAPEKGSVGASIPGLDTMVSSGKLRHGLSVDDHVKVAESFLGKHKENLQKSLATLQGLMPEGAKVKGRVKTLDSALGKLVRKPKYGAVDKLQDGTGMRVIAQDTETLDKSIAALKKNYKIVEQDDYVSKPLGGAEGLGYRSYHAIIEDADGLQKEIQLRTPNQNTHADWCHDVYKPVNADQEKAMSQHSAEIAQYARDMGDFFEKVDKAEKPGEQPPCPEPVKQYFTCL